MPTIIKLIDSAGDWLREEKDTKQWNSPWPDLKTRDDRVTEGVVGRRTWILWDGGSPIASVTINTSGSADLWNEEERRDEAVYIHRLVIDRRYAGTGLGAELIRWAELRGRRVRPRAKLIRIDVWSDNHGLHAYYSRQGFQFVALRETPDQCPSGALFQKRIRRAPWAGTPRIVTEEPLPAQAASPAERSPSAGVRRPRRKAPPLRHALEPAPNAVSGVNVLAGAGMAVLLVVGTMLGVVRPWH
ncbi:GNAT family N-acetyltransferase [Spirillospora sp. NPDC047279]|uniref:GNAT family N-acetyltransferase n=1 Tax=Spirillospora sp. NPDC047279 TaxID=3155478 RepID=UPI0033D2B360